MLQSEFDEPAALPADFAELLAAVEAALTDYRSGGSTSREAAEQLAGLVLTDADGVQWTVGATSRRWYRRSPGGAWVAGPPPAADAPTEVQVTPELLSVVGGAGGGRSELDQPSAQWSTLLEPDPALLLGAEPAAGPGPGLPGAAEHAVLDLELTDPVAPTAPPAALDAVPDAGPGVSLPDGVSSVLALPDVDPVAVGDQAQDAPEQGPLVWEASGDIPEGAVPLPAGLSSTLSWDPADADADSEPVEAPAPASDVAPALAGAPGVNLSELLAGYTPAAAAEPAVPDAGAGDDADVLAMLAELAAMPPAGPSSDVQDVTMPPLKP